MTSGNLAFAEAMRQINPDVVAAYPITPSTEIPVKFAEFVADGKVDSEYIAVESEHSAISGLCGSLGRRRACNDGVQRKRSGAHARNIPHSCGIPCSYSIWARKTEALERLSTSTVTILTACRSGILAGSRYTAKTLRKYMTQCFLL